MHAPQYIFLTFQVIALLGGIIKAARNNDPVGSVSSIIAIVTGVGLLMWGGFYPSPL